MTNILIWKTMERYADFFKKILYLEKHDHNRNALMLMDENEHVSYITYKETLETARKYANFLNDDGIKKGDTILILTKLIPDLWYISISSSYSGIIYSPTPVLLSKSDLRYKIMETKAKAIFTDSDALNLVSQSVKGIYILKFMM